MTQKLFKALVINGRLFYVGTRYAALRVFFGSVLTSNAPEGKNLCDIAAS